MPLAFRVSLHHVNAAIIVLPAAYRGRNTLGRARTRCAGRDGAACLYSAIDVGANLRFFAYALSNIADSVLAFEP